MPNYAVGKAGGDVEVFRSCTPEQLEENLEPGQVAVEMPREIRPASVKEGQKLVITPDGKAVKVVAA